MKLLKEYLIPWIASNSIAILILAAAIIRPKLARLLFVIMFALACWVNLSTVHNNAEDYLEYAALTPFGFYADFINGWFRENITTMVTLIAIGQGLISLGMMLKGWLVRIAGIGAIVFFFAIAPLGIGSAFPFSLIASIAILLILKNDNLNFLWKFKWRKRTLE